MPLHHADKHFFVCGATGSGKTTLIRLYLQSIVHRLQSGANEQIVIFDPKGDVLPILAGMGFGDRDDNVWVFNPFDERSCVWNIADSMQSPALARYLASLLVPEEVASTSPFFWQAAREMVCAVIVALNEIAQNTWDLRDLLCAFDKKEFVLNVCAHHERSNLRAEMFFKDEKHVMGVLTSIIVRIAQFETVAALWKTNSRGRKFTIENFLKKPGILVLGHDDTYKTSIWPINALVMRALTDEILRRENHAGPRHWFVFDEFPAMEKAEFVSDLLNRGRSKGASVMLGSQSIEGIVKCHGPEKAEEILGNCANKTFLRAGGPRTANWMESYFGKVRFTETSWSNSWSKDGSSTSESQSTQDRSQFNSSFFSSMPFPERGGPMMLVGDGPGTGPVVAARPFDQVLSWLCSEGKVPGVLLRSDANQQSLKKWTDAEAEFFCAAARKRWTGPSRRRS